MSLHANPQSVSCAYNPTHKPYLLFDAGGTLVFPDHSFIVQTAKDYGLDLSGERLWQGYCQLFYTLDHRAYKQGRVFPSDPWPQGYACVLLESIGIGGPVVKAINQTVLARHRLKSLWSFTLDWVGETLSLLAAEGYRMSVITNSDGRTANTLREVGLAHYFDRIFCSKDLEVEKPNPVIFEQALATLKLQPFSALYIGDIFVVDIQGANAAKIGGIHLDPLGLYNGWPGVHLPDIRHLPSWLAEYVESPLAYDLFPFGSPKSTRTERQERAVNAPAERSDKNIKPPLYSQARARESVPNHFHLPATEA